MIHAVIPLAAIAMIAAILALIDWLRVREERRRRNLWRQRAPRRRPSPTSGHRHGDQYR